MGKLDEYGKCGRRRSSSVICDTSHAGRCCSLHTIVGASEHVSAENLIVLPICPSGTSKSTTGLVLGRTDELTSGVRIELRTFAWTLCFREYLHLAISRQLCQQSPAVH